MIKLSINAINLLRYVLAHNGEKEVKEVRQFGAPMQVEVDAPRRLGGVESSQRRHFYKATDDILTEYNDEVRKRSDAFTEFKKTEEKNIKDSNPKEENEDDKKYNARITAKVNAAQTVKDRMKEINEDFKTLSEIKHDVELSDKTTEVVKKYYLQFGEEIGYTTGDDDIVDEINQVFNIKE